MRQETRSAYQERILQVLLYIQQHLDEDLTLDELAAVAHFSPCHFHRIFRGMVGESLAGHIRRLKLERAAGRLMHTRHSVTDLAFEAGYWYDYFEKPIDADNIPHIRDRKAVYRQWYDEFDKTGYTLAMPVNYTWYNTFGWYDFDNPDYRWFHNLLLTASNCTEHNTRNVPVVGFVHWHTTAPPENPDPAVKQFSKEKYRELLWHFLLRGYDSFFLWCLSEELPEEISLLHQVYADSLRYNEFFEKGTPVTFDVPEQESTVISAIAYNNKLLIRRTDFDANNETIILEYNGSSIEMPPAKDKCAILDVSGKDRDI